LDFSAAILIALNLIDTRATRLSDFKSKRRAVSRNCGRVKVSRRKTVSSDIWYLSAHDFFCCHGRGTNKAEGNFHLYTEDAARQNNRNAPLPDLVCPVSALSPDLMSGRPKTEDLRDFQEKSCPNSSLKRRIASFLRAKLCLKP
jgi:hypothetical protein